MTDNARKIITSSYGLKLAYLISRFTPERFGHRIAVFAADIISRRKNWKMVRAVRCNQWIATGKTLDNAALDKLVAKNFRNIAISIFDYYHNIYDPAASLRAIVPHPVGVGLVQRPEFTERGLVLAGVHMSNFDVAFQVGGLAGINGLALTLSELNLTYQKQWTMRSKNGIRFVVASIGSMKYAINHLRKGGMIITAIDRPDEKSSYHPRFFGYPSAMPVHHIFLALKAQVPIIVVAINKHSDGKYYFFFSDPIEMQPHPDRHTEIMLNAENVLRVAEDFIRHDTSQWAMTFPVWPEALSQVMN